MKVNNPTEAFFIAAEMERRAIRMYELMDLLVDQDETRNMLRDLLKDERTHLERFTSWLNGQIPACEDALILSAEAAGILFPGGLTEALRHSAAGSAEAMRLYAIEQEKVAVNTYLLFASQCTGDAKQAFLCIADEEQQHLNDLMAM